jgi:FAD/FMN-containing dehydrogenase
MGNTTSTPGSDCLLSAVGGDSDLVSFPSDPFYQLDAVKRYNLNYDITPAAVTFPKTTEQVSEIVKCAVKYDHKVQPRGGGHSYGDYC